MQLRRLLLLVSAIVFVDTMFYAVVAPLLPHYADTLDLSKASAGLLTAAYPAGTLLGSIPAGLLAARTSPRTAVLLGLGLLGASSLVFGFAHHIVLLDAARFAQGVGGACSWAGGLAWLLYASPPERRGAMIGTALGVAIGGALFGPVVGAVAEAVGPEWVFGSVLVVCAALALWALRVPTVAAREDQGLPELRAALRVPRVASGMWLVALPALGFGAIGVLIPLRLDDLGASSAAVGATFLVAAALEGVVSPVLGRASDRLGRMRPIRVGLLASAGLILVLPVPDTAVVTAAVVVGAAGAFGMFWAPAMAMLSDAAEETGLHQGLAFALVNLSWAAGQVTGSAGSGALAKATADAVPFTIVAALCLLTLARLRSFQGGELRTAAP